MGNSIACADMYTKLQTPNFLFYSLFSTPRKTIIFDILLFCGEGELRKDENMYFEVMESFGLILFDVH